MITLTEEVKKKMVAYYKSRPMTHQEVCQKFGCSLPTVIKVFKQYKVKNYGKAILYSPDLVENYFETIDTEKKAYFLGLFITDGCVHYSKHNHGYIVSLTLQDSDKYILEEFKAEIKCNKKITSDNRGCSELQICSNKMAQDLAKYGVIPNKTFRAVFPKNINEKLYPHLIRGILDGDGNVSYYCRKNRRVHTKAIRICQANIQFLEDIVDFLHNTLNTDKVTVVPQKENLWMISYYSNQSIYKIYHYLYDSATTYFHRKKELCDKIIDEILYYQGNTEITE